MDFRYYFQLQLKKLRKPKVMNSLFDIEGRIIGNHPSIVDVRNHLPLIPDDFWETLVVNLHQFEEPADFIVDAYLLNYIFGLISWYTAPNLTEVDPNFSIESVVYASQFYYELLDVVGFSHFNPIIFGNTLVYAGVTAATSPNANYSLALMESLHRLLKEHKLQVRFEDKTLSTLCNIIQFTSSKIHKDFTEGCRVTNMCHEALLILKTMTVKSYERGRKYIFHALLTGTKKTNPDRIQRTPEEAAAKSKINFRNLMVYMKDLLCANDSDHFSNSLLYMVSLEEEIDVEEVHNIMKALGEEFYKTVMCKLSFMSVSEECPERANIMNLFYTMLSNIPTQFYTLDKLDVFVQTILRNCCMNCVQDDLAISIMAKIILDGDMVVMTQLEVLFNTVNESMNSKAVFVLFASKFCKRSHGRTMNRNIMIILIQIMISSDTVLTKEYQDVLDIVASEGDPNDVRLAIGLLCHLYTAMMRREVPSVANKVIRIFHNMSMHPSRVSGEFLKVLYLMLLEPSEAMKPFSRQFHNSLQSELYGMKGFVKKCLDSGLVSQRHQELLIEKFLLGDHQYLKMTCCVFETVVCPRLFEVIAYVTQYDELVSEDDHILITYFLNNCMKNLIDEGRIINIDDRNSVIALELLLKYKLSTMSLPQDAISNSIVLLTNIAKFMKRTLDLNFLVQNLEEELQETLTYLPNIEDVLPVIHASEYVLFTEYKLSEAVVTQLVEGLENCILSPNGGDHPNEIESKSVCLVLYTRICVKNKQNVRKAFDLLKAAFRTESTTFQYTLFDMLYDLCIFFLHNFDEFIVLAFRQLKSTSDRCKHQAAKCIEEMVAKEFIKLDMQQYCKFVCLLGDMSNGFGITFKQIVTNFAISNTKDIEKYFLPLIIHTNLYLKHDKYPMDPAYIADMQCIIKPVFNKWHIYYFLFRSLSRRSQFLVAKEICTDIFEPATKGLLKIDDGVWRIIDDGIMIFKIMEYDSQMNSTFMDFYLNTLEDIKLYIIDEENYRGNLKQPDMLSETALIIYSLLHLMFYTENDHILIHYKYQLFDSIMFWTAGLFPDIIEIFKSDEIPYVRKQLLVSYFAKLQTFFDYHKEFIQSRACVSENNVSEFENLTTGLNQNLMQISKYEPSEFREN